MKNTLSNDSGCNLIEYENGDCRPNHSNKRTLTTNPSEGNWELEEILRRLQILIEKDGEKDKIDFYCKRWIEAAEVIDRFFFWIFIFGTTLASLLLLVIIPMTKSVTVNDEVPV
jgi:hypothetical protein